MPLLLVCRSLTPLPSLLLFGFISYLFLLSFFFGLGFHFLLYNVGVVCSVPVYSRCVAAFAALKLASVAWRLSAVVAPKMWESVEQII
jgi:hypothetical protein